MSEDAAGGSTAKSRRNAFLALGLVAAGTVAAWFWAHSANHHDRNAGKNQSAASVGIARSALADMPVWIHAIGTVQPVTTATVRAQEAGVLVGLRFTEGQMVHKGQVLAEIDPRPFRLALVQAEANFARDAAQLHAAEVDLARYQALWKQDSIAHQQVDTQTALVQQLKGTLGADRAAIGTARLNLGYTSIVAPVSGRIGLRQADLGNYLTAADANGIAVITVTDPIDVAFALPQEQIAAIRQRQSGKSPIPVTALDQNGASVLAKGNFLTLDNQIDPSSGTVKAKARFTNAASALFPNQFVNIALLANTLPHVVTVPTSAVRHGPQGDFLFELQGADRVKLHLVKTGPSDGTVTAILAGLAPGVPVVTTGADGLDDGSKVRLADRGGDAAPGGHHRHHDGGSAVQ